MTMDPYHTTYSVMVHSTTHNNEDLILNKDLFDSLFQDGDYVQIYDPSYSFSNSYPSVNQSLILQIKSTSFQVVTNGGRLEISLSKSVADPLNVKSMNTKRFCIHKIDPSRSHVDFVELSFKKQFLSRGNMWRFKNAILGRPIYVGQQIIINRIQAQIQEIGLKGATKISGVIAKDTNFIFRSRSTRIIWLVQISGEMWANDENGVMYFDKFLSKFVDPLLDRWKSLGVSHSLTIIFYSRTFRFKPKSCVDSSGNTESSIADVNPLDKRSYEDHYKVVIENSAEMDKVQYLKILKREFWEYATGIGWHLNSPDDDIQQSSLALPSDSYEGNFLEAINTTLNILDKHYMDRDLLRTGNSIVMISAGVGVFKVKPQMSQITKQRMMDSGIGIDFISLSQPPLHAVPLFHVDCSDDNVADFYEQPHWINVSFVDCNCDSSTTVESSADDEYEETKRVLTVSPYIKNYRWTGLADFQVKSTKFLRSAKLIAANETVDERWGREFKPLPFSSILAGHILSCHSNLPRPLIALLRNTHKSYRIYDANKGVIVSEWGYLPFDKLFKNLSLENMRSSYRPSDEEINDYQMRLPKYRTRIIENVTETAKMHRHDSVNSLYTEDSTSGEYHRVSSSHDSKGPMFEIGRSIALSSSFASSDVGSYSKSYLSKPFRSYFGSSSALDSEQYLSRGLNKFNFCSDSDIDDPIILQGLVGSIPMVDMKSFDNDKFISLQNAHPSRNQSTTSSGDYIVDVDAMNRGRGNHMSGESSPIKYSEKSRSDNVRRPQHYANAIHALDSDNQQLAVDKVPIPHRNSSPLLAKQSKTLSFGNPSYITAEVNNYANDHNMTTSSTTAQDKEVMPKVQIREYRRKSQSNPFRKEEGVNYLNARTHNRRRWSYVFPTGKLGKSMVAFYGLNWKSLTQPAVLPTTTDYIPTVKDLHNNYDVQSNYRLIIDKSECAFDTIENLLMEMICQRLAMEFQFVEIDDLTQYVNYSNLNHNLLSQPSSQSFNRLMSKPTDTSNFYILSMGHRIQFLSLKPDSREIEVTLLLSKLGLNDNDRTMTYNYKLWVPQTCQYVPMLQTFTQFPPEYLWNKADSVLMGAVDFDFNSETNKAKRLRFNIVPKNPVNATDEEEYFAGLEKFFQVVKKYVFAPDAIKIVFENNVKVTIEKESCKASSEDSRFSMDNSNIRKQTDTVKLWFSGPGNDQPKWAYFRYDKRASTSKMFHFELHWFACDAWLMEDFVNHIYRRCSAFGLRLAQVPESFYTQNLRIHPFRAQLYIPIITSETLKNIMSLYVSPVTIFEYLFIKLDDDKWIRDDPQNTDWKSVNASSLSVFDHGKSQLTDMLSELGLKPTPIPTTQSILNASYPKKSLSDIKVSEVRKNTNSQPQDKNVMKSYYGKIGITATPPKSLPNRQYMHRHGFAGLRIGSEGIIWLLNTATRVNDINISTEEKKAVASAALKQFTEKCTTTCTCLELVVEIIEDAMKGAGKSVSL